MKDYFEKEYILLECVNKLDTLYDAYDASEFINSKPKLAIKALNYFYRYFPKLYYDLGIAKRHVYDENIKILGELATDLNKYDMATDFLNIALASSNHTLKWGLPFNWKSGKYTFEKGLLMSTTTAEMALFILEYSKRFDVDLVLILRQIANILLSELNKIVDTEYELLLSYTPVDDYKVLNSNLIVANSLCSIGTFINDNELISNANRIVCACAPYISDTGAVTYMINGGQIDSYHQVFSIKALYNMRHINPLCDELYKKTLNYLEKYLIDDDYNVRLYPNSKLFDLQGAAEVLDLYKLNGDIENYKNILKQIKATYYNDGKLYQRIKEKNNIFYPIIKTAYYRQGILRLAKALI